MVLLTELRTQKRIRTLINADVRDAYRPVGGDVNLIDISLTGAGFESNINFEMGDKVIITLGSIRINGIIRRVSMEGFRQYFYGIEFMISKNSQLRMLEDFLTTLPDIVTYC